jgi:hypothetical protein
MAPISAESHAISPVPERHCCVCWTIACIRLKSVADTNPLAENPFPTCRKNHRTNVMCFTSCPVDPL